MGTDYWPDEDTNPIVDFGSIGFFYAAGTVTAGYPVKLATGTAGYIKCQNTSAAGDSIGIALKSASSGEWVPVAIFGLVKLVADGSTTNIATGDIVYSNGSGKVVKADSTYTNYKLFGGNYYALGIALHPSTASDDEILVLLGKIF